MKRSLFALLLATSLAAQASTVVDITAEPHHHLVMTNKYVRVFQVEVPPGEATLMHRHRYDYAYVTLGAVSLANEVEGKGTSRLDLRDGEIRFSAGNFAHAIRDLSNTPFRNVTIEFLQGHKTAADWQEERGLDILDGGTQDILFAKDGVRASDVQLNPGGTLPRNKGAAGQLIVAVTSIDLASKPDTGQGLHLKAGEVRWLNPTALINAGKQPARFISFDFR